MIGESREFLLKWNEAFPLDHWWREKYSIPFNSPKHRSVSYIDIYYDWLEYSMFEQYVETEKQNLEKLANYKKTGKWLSQIENKQEKEKMHQIFDDVDVSMFNEHLIDEEDESNDNPEY